MNTDRTKKPKKQKSFVVFKLFLLMVFVILFFSFLFGLPRTGDIDYSSFFISDATCLITSLGIEVSFVTYIEQTVYNRSFRHDVLAGLTKNTILDGVILSLMAISVGVSGFFLSKSLSLAVLSTVFSAVSIAAVFFSMYFLSNETDPIKQAKFHMKRFFLLFDGSLKNDSFGEWADVRSIFEDCLSAGEYQFCEQIALSWTISVYQFIKSEEHLRLSEKDKEKALDREKDLIASFYFFLTVDYGNVGRESLLRILHHLTCVAACFKLDSFSEACKFVEKYLSLFFQNGTSDETSLCILFRSFFFVGNTSKRNNNYWSNCKNEKPGEYVQAKKEVVFEVCDLILFSRHGNENSVISSLLVQDLLGYLTEPKNPITPKAFSLYIELLLGFVNSPFPEGSEESVQAYFSDIIEKKDDERIREYIDRFLLSDDLKYKCVRNMAFADLVLTQIDQALLLGYKTKELFEASFSLAGQIVWAEDGVVASDIIPSDATLSQILKNKQIQTDDFIGSLRSLFMSAASNKQIGYLENILSCLDYFIFEPDFAFCEKNPYLQFFFSIFTDTQCKDRDVTKRVIVHFDKDLRKADSDGKLTEDALDHICENVESCIVWKTTSSSDESLDLAWFLRNLVEKKMIIGICRKSEKAARIVYSHISYCGETAVEDGQTEVLQIMSAALGWGAVWEYQERNRKELSGYILKRGTGLFVLCLNVLGDCSQSVFVGTLVVVHGAFSIFTKNTSATKTIEGQLKESRIDPLPILHKSLDLRKNQDSWQELLESDVKKSFNEFWKQLQEMTFLSNDQDK